MNEHLGSSTRCQLERHLNGHFFVPKRNTNVFWYCDSQIVDFFSFKSTIKLEMKREMYSVTSSIELKTSLTKYCHCWNLLSTDS